MNKQPEQLEQNELVEWLDKKFGHLRPYTSQILFGLLALVALGFAVAYLIYSRMDVQAKQWQTLSSAINTFNLDRQTSHLTNIAEEFPDAESSMWALQLAGDVEMANGLQQLNSDPQSAVRTLEKAQKYYNKLLDSPTKKSTDLIQRATYALAYCTESLGQFEEAKKLYQKIVDQAGTSVYADPSKMALERLAQPEIVAFYEAYKRSAVAPLGELPKRPDISFPEAPAAESSSAQPPATETPAAAPAAAAEQPAAAPAAETEKKDGGQ
jgi:tetratricopeptide (TPR) repeat protein